MLERAKELRLFDFGPTEDLLARTVGHPGHGRLRRALDLYRPPRAPSNWTYSRHGTREAFERDRVRQEDLKLAGIELTRVTGRRFEREPGQVMERVARLLAQRGRVPPRC
jgi:hypothetical protein